MFELDRQPALLPAAPGAPGGRGPGSVLAGRYRLGALLGSGGTAEVFQASDLRLARPVAAKVFRDRDWDALQTARFNEEARLLAALCHPGLVPLYDAGVDGARRFIVMPLIRGLTLADAARRGPVGQVEARRIGLVLAAALAHVHSKGIVHRDVKPGNVLLEPGGGVYLSDFGIARATDSPNLTVTGCLVGTAGYLSPEQVKGLGAGPASDSYSLGLTLLEALTGCRTYRGTPLEQALAVVTRPPAVPTSLGPQWCGILTSLTDPDPRRRPSMEEAEACFAGLRPFAHDLGERGQRSPARSSILERRPL